MSLQADTGLGVKIWTHVSEVDPQTNIILLISEHTDFEKLRAFPLVNQKTKNEPSGGHWARSENIDACGRGQHSKQYNIAHSRHIHTQEGTFMACMSSPWGRAVTPALRTQ